MTGNPSKLINADNAELLMGGPLEALDFNSKARLKQILSDPDPGNLWKLDVPEEYLADNSPIPSNYYARGLLIELQQFKKIYKKQGFEHHPTAKGFDYSNATTCVQMKSLKNPPASIQAMKEAIGALIEHTPAGKKMQLHIVIAPGTSDTALRAALNSYIGAIPDAQLRSRILVPIIEVISYP